MQQMHSGTQKVHRNRDALRHICNRYMDMKCVPQINRDLHRDFTYMCNINVVQSGQP